MRISRESFSGVDTAHQSHFWVSSLKFLRPAMSRLYLSRLYKACNLFNAAPRPMGEALSGSKEENVKDRFHHFAHKSADLVGSPMAFIIGHCYEEVTVWFLTFRASSC